MGKHKTTASRKGAGRAADSVEKVYEAIKDLAVDYRFKPGERINEVELAAGLGVSRTPVREALNRLVRDGFMTFVPNRGFYARDITPEGVQELYELRAAIERAAFKLACERGTDADIADVIAIWDDNSELASSADWEKVAEADEDFHTAVVRLSKNAPMLNAVEGINSLIRFFRRIDLESSRRRSGLYDEHAAIIDCLRRRDGERGGEFLERHITLSSAHAVEVAKEGLARIFFGRPN
ncbi:MAG: GntR family transcriptional regulator [Rhizobiaceae bacterium]|jgi:DNA-binding GntR family transcriptional regulator|nr:GntR family transcriptional regulator [Rhizobiaceae bacterium]